MSKDSYYWECMDCGKYESTLHRVYTTNGVKVLCTDCVRKENQKGA